MRRFVVDASPIILLGRIDHLSLLADLSDDLIIPAAVADEIAARAFSALSILGSEDDSRDFATYMRAAATAEVVFDRNPLHPGAAHYIIHSFDDPVHAPLGLQAANAYADIAPNAAHAQHMTSHIFVAMGLWERAVEANIRAMETQDAELAREGEAPNVCGHYSSWLHYAHLQLGEAQLRHGNRDEAVVAFQRAVERTPGRSLAEEGLNDARGE